MEPAVEIGIASACLLTLFVYHGVLIWFIRNRPLMTTIGRNHKLRYYWVHSMMDSQLPSRDILAVQTIRNTLMVSTLFTTVTILLGTLVGSVSSNIIGSMDVGINQIKAVFLAVCFLLSFFCFQQNLRLVAHVNYHINLGPRLAVLMHEENPALLNIDVVAAHFQLAMDWYSAGIRLIGAASMGIMWVFGAPFAAGWTLILLMLFYQTDYLMVSKASRHLESSRLPDSVEMV